MSVSDARRSFRLAYRERGTVPINVNRRASYERIAGFGALEPGMRGIEVLARRVDGRSVARSVERSGAGGEHGGDD